MDLMKKTGVYCITHKESGKMYIGQTIRSFVSRWYGHKSCKIKHPLYNAFKKYGTDAFDFQPVLISNDQNEINKLERQLIKALNTTDRRYGYNLDLGGNGAGKMSEETKEKIRKSCKGKKDSQETINKKISSLKGRVVSEETKNKIRESLKGIGAGRNNPRAKLRKIQDINTGTIYEGIIKGELDKQIGVNFSTIYYRLKSGRYQEVE